MRTITRPVPNLNAPVQAASSDNDIRARLDRLASLYGGRTAFVPSNAIWTLEMRTEGAELAVALGLNSERAYTLRDHELWDFYVTARKAPEGGRRLARKLNGHLPTQAPVAAPVPGPSVPVDAEALKALMDKLADGVSLEARELVRMALASVPALVQAEAEARLPRRIEVVNMTAPAVTITNPHMAFDEVLDYCMAREDVFMVGPAGSGKTTIAEHVATALGLPFYGESKVEFASTLAGYKNITTGAYVRSNMREAYEHGGVFLLDEGDASNASALLFINAAISNGWCLFPDGRVTRHDDFICIVAANTYGRGHTRKYIGRAKLDGAFLDRFAMLDIDYDEALETILAGNKDWCKYVQAIRAVILDTELEAIVSPRATYKGSKMLARGRSWEDVAKAYIWKGMNAEDRRTVEASVPMARFETSIL